MKVTLSLLKIEKKQDIETCLDLIRNTLEVDCHVEDLKQVFRLGQGIGQIMTDRPTSDQFLLNSDPICNQKSGHGITV